MKSVLCIAVSALLAYANSFDVPFVFDDIVGIVRNRGVVFDGYPLLFPRGLTYNSYQGQSQLWHYHAVNLGIHVANSSLVYLLSGSLFGGLLFALHPIQTESVTYLSGRAELLACFFVLMGAWICQKSVVSAVGISGRALIVAALFPLAMLSKENAIIYPVLIGLAYMHQYGLPSCSWKWALPIVLSTAYAGYWALEKGATGFLTSVPDSLVYLKAQCWVFVRYVGLILVPIGQNIDPEVHVSWPKAVFGAQLALLLAFIAFKYRKTAIGFGLAWFLIALTPTSTVVPIADLMAEHRLYLPMVGVGLMFGKRS